VLILKIFSKYFNKRNYVILKMQDKMDDRDSDDLLKNLRKKSIKKAKKEVKYIFEDSNLSLWLKSNEAKTYVRFQFDLRDAYRRMKESEYLIDAISDHLDLLISREIKLGHQAGKLKAGLKPWEIHKIWLSYSGIDNWYKSKVKSFSEKGFFKKIRDLFSDKNKNLLKGELLKEEFDFKASHKIVHGEFNFQSSYKKHSFDLINLINLVFNFTIKALYFILEWSFKCGLSIIVFIGLLEILDEKFRDNGSWNIILALFSSISLIQIISTAIYNLYISEDSDNKSKADSSIPSLQDFVKHFHGFSRSIILIFLCFTEGFLGHNLLYSTMHQSHELNKPNVLGFKFDPSLALLSSTFVIANVLFAVAKAKRYNYSLERKENFLALVEEKNDVMQQINYFKGELTQASLKFERYKKEVQDLLYDKQNGIFSQIVILSSRIYTDPTESIPLSLDEIDTIIVNQFLRYEFNIENYLLLLFLFFSDIDLDFLLKLIT
jgi:hypothetical protein